MKPRTEVKHFEDHRVSVTVSRLGVMIEATWVDPEEGEINAVESVTLSRAELAWVVSKALG